MILLTSVRILTKRYMRTLIIISALVGLASCHDGRTWESETNGPEANMATCNQHTDITTVPADNRTGNPAYHLRLDAERGIAPAEKPEGDSAAKPAEGEHH
jgi:hypothetical protein